MGPPGLHEIDHKERITLCMLVHQTRQPVDQLQARQASGEIGGNSVLGQHCQWQFHAVPVQLQFLLDGGQGMGTAPHFGRPIRADEEQARRFRSARQYCQQVQSGGIAPVQVFEHQHQRLPGSQQFQGLSQLPQHPFPRCPDHAAPQRLQVTGTDQTRHLHQPGRGLLPQERHQLLPTGSPAQAPQCLQHRQVSLPDPVVLDALPAPDPQGSIGCNLCYKCFHQRGLAQSRLARDEDDLAKARARSDEPGVEVGQFCLAPDRRDSAAHERWRPARGRSSYGRREMLLNLDRRHKAIALSVHRVQQAWFPPLLSQRLA